MQMLSELDNLYKEKSSWTGRLKLAIQDDTANHDDRNMQMLVDDDHQ